MVDTNQSPPRTVAEITKNSDADLPSHACDNPDLNALEFLLAVMHDRTFPLSVRMKAAEGAAPYFTPRPGNSRHYPCVGYHLTYVIPDNLSLRQGHEPRTPEQINANSQSKSQIRSNSHHPSSETPAPLYTETNSYPLSFDDIQQIKAAVQRLHPDADLSQLPDHLTLCECGHWIPFPCKCASIN
jgi:hypothetical protein